MGGRRVQRIYEEGLIWKRGNGILRKRGGGEERGEEVGGTVKGGKGE